MRYSLFIILCLSLAFCKNKKGKIYPADTDTAIVAMPGTDSSTKKNTIPTSASTYWVYNTTHFNSSGEVEVSDQDTIRITKTNTFNGRQFFFINPFWFANKDWNTILAYDSLTNNEFEIKNNASVDSSLVKYVARTGAPDHKRGVKLFLYKSRRVINKLDCYKIAFAVNTWTGKPFSVTVMYFSEGVGIVRAEEYRYNSDKKYLQTTQEIDVYHVEPSAK